MNRVPMRVIVVAAALVLCYVVGLGVRQRYGIRIVVRNLTPELVRDVRVSVENSGGRYTLGDVPAGGKRAMFVQPVTESHVDVGFTDVNGTHRVVTVMGYAERGYCGRSAVTILPDSRVESSDSLGCWRSWLDFM